MQKRKPLRWAIKHLVPFFLASLLAIFGILSLFSTPAEAQPIVVSLPLPTAQVTVSYSATLTATGGSGTYTSWTVSSGALPPGLTLNAATGTISGTPTLAGTYNFFVRVTDTTPLTSAPQSFFITVTAKPITFLYNYLSQATEGASYQANVAVEGGTTPYTFSLISGVLPTGLNLDLVNGSISGTPIQGTAGTYTITISVTDSSTPRLTAQQSYSLVVKKGFYESVISISSTLSMGEANILVDGTQTAKLQGGQSTRLSFPVGTKPVITATPIISHPTRADIRFVLNNREITVSEASPDATFTYTPEYYITLNTDPPQITSLSGTDYYKEGNPINATAPTQIEGKTAGTQYRFSYWLLPNGDKLQGEGLNWIVSAPGKVIATYDTYYLLTVTSPQGKVDGNGWYKAGATTKWSVSPPEIPMSGLLGLFKGKLKPDNATGTEFMDAPKTVAIAWNPDYTMPAIFIPLSLLFLIGVILGVYRLMNPPVPKPAVAPLPPAPAAQPTIVVMGGAQQPRLETTKDQLVDQFRQLLEKYEGEVKTTLKAEELPEAKLVPESQRLASPTEAPSLACGHTTKKLLRTVVGNWRKTEERTQIQPSSDEVAEKGISLVTVWTRDIYNEWEIFTCSLPHGHSGKHKSTVSVAYSLQNTVTEERTYGAKQQTTPPKPHFTDELPIVDVVDDQIIDADTPNQVVMPDEVFPPDEP